MIYESRTYTLHPGKLGEYLGCFAAAPAVVELLRPHLRGFWFTESGALNTVHHLWEYEGRAQRAMARAQLGQQPEMGEFFGKVTPLLQSQRSVLMTGTVKAAQRTERKGGVYDRIVAPVGLPAAASCGLTQPGLADALHSHFEVVAELERSAFELAGPVVERLFVVRSESLAERDRQWSAAGPLLQAACAADGIAIASCELVLPVAFSPWP